MTSRSRQILAIVLLLASAAPPPRVTNALIAAAHRHDRPEAGKTVQSRARNRIGPAAALISRLDGSGVTPPGPRPGPSPRPSAREYALEVAPRPAHPTPRVAFRLRC